MFADVKLAVECLQIVFVIYCIVVFKGNGDCRFCVCENTAFIVFTLKMKGMLMKYFKNNKKKQQPTKGFVFCVVYFLCSLWFLWEVKCCLYCLPCVYIESEVLCSLCLHQE